MKMLSPREYLRDLESINLETHSRCNMEKEHRCECPIVKRSEAFGNFKLSIDIMESVFKELKRNGYKGLTGFHHYSDPMADKRIFDIVKLYMAILPEGKCQIWTNGRLLTQEKAERLLELGVCWIHISAYTNDEYFKYNNLVTGLRQRWPEVHYEVVRQVLDTRISIYKDTVNDITRPCPRIKEQLVIASSGDIQLCCNDWLRINKYGNLYKDTLTKILEKSDYLSTRQDLLTGKRGEHYPCDRCKA